MKTYLLIGLVSFLVLIGCKKNEVENLPPQPFRVIVSDSTSNSAEIEWEPSFDPDYDSVFYSVRINNELKASKLFNIYKLEVKDLLSNTQYSGVVTATDSRLNSHEEPFTFSTRLNSAPDPFKVEVRKVSYNLAVIEWEKATDIDNDSVTYSVLFNGYEIASNLPANFSYEISDLVPETYYEGLIRAVDSKNNIRDIPFNFSTKKYYLMFSKVWYYIDEYRVSPFNIEKTSDRGYILATNGYIPDQNYMLAVKLDSLANIEWRTGIALDPGVGGEHLIKPTRINEYLMLGEKRLVKLNDHGDVVWEFIPGGELEYQRTALISFVQTSDNGFIVVGNYFTGAADLLLWQQGLIIKINENGGLEWKKLIGTSWRTYVCQVVPSEDGNYILAGTAGNDSNQELMLTKIDNTGNTLSIQTYPVGGYNFVKEMKVTKDNGLIIAGNRMGNLDITEARIIKIKNNGTVEWDKFFLWHYFKTHATSIEQMENNGYVFTGMNGYEWQQSYLAKIDLNGNLEWNRFYNPISVGINSQGWNLKATDDGGFIVLGTKHDVYESGMWIFKTDPVGNFEY